MPNITISLGDVFFALLRHQLAICGESA